ncbi:MAG: M20 family metallopeptidase [Clostridia bacterium]
MNWTSFFQEKQDEILKELQTYVEIETPTHNKPAVDRLGERIAERFARLGCKVERIAQPAYGDQLRIECGEGEEQLLILGHFDTVKEIGTLTQEPWRIEDGKAYGPGTYDMKAGIVFAYFALQAILTHKLPLSKKLVFFWNTDEEVGSPSSEALIRKEARQSVAALVIEPSFGEEGLIKTSRKGGGEFILHAKGRSAHAGNDHAKGINAIEEIAHQIVLNQTWTYYAKGTTLSVGEVKGGTVSNVVPESATAVIDVRVSQKAEAARITQLMQQLAPVVPGATLELHGKINKPPMERTEGTVRLFALAQQLAKEEGFSLDEIGVGGTSDGNFVADEGIPVLDGLGPVGDGAHASHEHVVISAMAQRIALLVRLFVGL